METFFIVSKEKNNLQSDLNRKKCSLNLFYLNLIYIFVSNLCVLTHYILEGFFQCESYS